MYYLVAALAYAYMHTCKDALQNDVVSNHREKKGDHGEILVFFSLTKSLGFVFMCVWGGILRMKQNYSNNNEKKRSFTTHGEEKAKPNPSTKYE